MKAIILAAGYATRLYPLTINTPKALLPINQKPIINYIVEELNTVPEIDEIYVVTNSRFAKQFSSWAQNAPGQIPIVVIDDGTTSDANKKGAVGDIGFVIDQKQIDDELLVIAGDNFFTYSLRDYVDFYRQKNHDCVCVREWSNKEELSQFGIALLDTDGRVLDIEEKPAHPKSNLAVFATYLYLRETVPMILEYLQVGNNPDAPGNFPAWLYRRKPVYAYVFSGECYDIGTPDSYRDVCKLFETERETAR